MKLRIYENVKTDSGNTVNVAPPSPETHNLKLEYRIALVGPDGPVVDISGSSEIPMALHPHFNLTASECCVQCFADVVGEFMEANVAAAVAVVWYAIRYCKPLFRA